MTKILRAVLVLFSCSLLPAQSNLATVNGVITDPAMNTVPKADVRVRSVETDAVRTAVTGSAGQFEVSGLTPGEYTIEIQAPGFAVTKHTIRLEVGQNMRLDVGLTMGEAKTSVDVTSSVEMLKTGDAAI